MEIEKFKEEKKALESYIQRSISDSLAIFRENTGYSPESISVYLIDVSTLGQENKHYVIGEVKIDVEL